MTTGDRRLTATLRERLFAPIDIAPLVYWRIAFGLLMLWDLRSYLGRGEVALRFVTPAYHFTFPGFDWVHPWPGNGMYLHFSALAILAVLITVGMWYRLAVALFWLGFTYVFLLDQAFYLNHFYLICLVSFLMIFLPAHRSLSVDAQLNPGLRARTAPAWTLWLLLGQMAVVYLYAGIAKLNGDWLRGWPLREWLANRSDLAVIGPWLTRPDAALAFSWGGMLLDLLIVPGLLWRPTRIPMLILSALFHLLNANLFHIGVFPWFSIAATLLFLPPEWLRPSYWSGVREDAAETAPVPIGRQRAVLALIGAYAAWQILLPLRHHLYPGHPHWTEEGHRFSWRMKLRHKDALPILWAVTPAGERLPIDPSAYLTPPQIAAMAARPDMIVQFAHHVADELERAGRGRVAIHSGTLVSLNGREPQLIVDPSVDLTTKRVSWRHADWIVPLRQPLPPATLRPEQLSPWRVEE